ncbi:hypothetical protein XSR1_270015 [Xenorhabdus szentirmaii DSM 16338]|uniref:Uncharacterized protein n=1 Tax=Xenorhabdus szentirmaii DSM 16338 TaxID=1427518 RepID=W1J0K0_9GAMM|nr:hypothetical protein XSR1_270015 [Xenorhabdus szentirmaii DSM 16338]
MRLFRRELCINHDSNEDVNWQYKEYPESHDTDTINTLLVHDFHEDAFKGI